MPGRDPYRDHHHELRSVFIHIPKTAGRSIHQTLSHDHSQHQSEHVPAKRFLAYDPRRYRQYFTFAVVRNPWNRFSSAFYSLRGSAPKRPRTSLGRAYVKFVRECIDPHDDVNRFCEWIAASRNNQRRVMRQVVFVPQHRWIADPYQGIIIDYVGSFERLDEAWAHISSELGVEGELPTIGRRAGRKDRVPLDERSIGMVGDLYKKDATSFGYGPPTASR